MDSGLLRLRLSLSWLASAARALRTLGHSAGAAREMQQPAEVACEVAGRGRQARIGPEPHSGLGWLRSGHVALPHFLRTRLAKERAGLTHRSTSL